MSTPTSRHAWREPHARAMAASIPAASSSGNWASSSPVAGSIERRIPTPSDYFLLSLSLTALALRERGSVRLNGGARTGQAEAHDPSPASSPARARGRTPETGGDRIRLAGDRRGGGG